MRFEALIDRLVAIGYSDETAEAKIAHDIVLMAVRDSGFHDNLTVKGGVVMSAITDIARRATMDMDVDFLRYPLTNEGIRKFVSGLGRVAPCRIRIEGGIETLHQQEYKGKRVRLTLTDEAGATIETKVDIGVHARVGIEQSDRTFRVVVDDGEVSLLANPNEQIFVEKLKSLLRFGSASTRFKDVFDLYYLAERTERDVVRKMLKESILDDVRMRENAIADVVARLSRVFGNRAFMRSLSKPANAWLDLSAEEVASAILAFISSLDASVD